MTKKPSIFKQIATSARNNGFITLAILWVSIMPTLGSLVFAPLAITNADKITVLQATDLATVSIFVAFATLTMGLALLPTTIFAGLTGFLFGWSAFPYLVLGYTLATLLGYIWGKGLNNRSLDQLLSSYPRVKQLLEKKSARIGELIFFVRLSPVIPFALSNLLFALLNTGWKRLIIWGTLGMLPRTTLVFVSGTFASDIWDAIKGRPNLMGIAAFVILLGLSFWGIWRFFVSRESKVNG